MYQQQQAQQQPAQRPVVQQRPNQFTNGLGSNPFQVIKPTAPTQIAMPTVAPVAKPQVGAFSDHQKWQINRLNQTTPMVVKDREKIIADSYNAINNPNANAKNAQARSDFYKSADQDRLNRIVGNQPINSRDEGYKRLEEGLTKQGKGQQLADARANVVKHNTELGKSWGMGSDLTANPKFGTQMNSHDALRAIDPQAYDALERSMNANKKTGRSGVNQVLNNFIDGATRTFAKAPTNATNALYSAVDAVAPEGSSIDKFSEKMRNFSQAKTQSINNAYDKAGVGQQAGDNPFLAVPSSGAGQIASGIITGGTNIGIATGVDVMGSTQRDMQMKGVDDETKQLLTSLPNAVVQGLLEKYGMDTLTSSIGKNILKKFLFKAGSEGTQEGLQELTGNIATNTYDKTQGILENVPQAAGWGAVLGGGTSLALGGMESPDNQNQQQTVTSPTLPTPPRPSVARPNEYNVLSDYQDVLHGNIKDTNVINQTISDARQAAQRVGVDITSGSPSDIDTRINEVLSRQAQPQSLQDPVVQNIPVNQMVDPQSMRDRIRAAKERVLTPLNKYGGSNADFDSPTITNDLTGKTIPNPAYKGETQLTPTQEIQAIQNKSYKSRGGKLTITEENRIAELSGKPKPFALSETKDYAPGTRVILNADGTKRKRESVNSREVRNANAKILNIAEDGDNYTVTIKENNLGDIVFTRTDADGNYMDSTTKEKLEKTWGKLPDEQLAEKSVYGNGKLISENLNPKGTAYADMKRGVTSQLQQQKNKTEQNQGESQQPPQKIEDRPSTSLDTSSKLAPYIDPSAQRQQPETKEIAKKSQVQVPLAPTVQRTNESSKGLVLAETKPLNGQTIQKVRTGKGQVEERRPGELTAQQYQQVFNTKMSDDIPNADPAFNAVAAGSKSNSTKKLIEAINQDEVLSNAAAEAQQEGTELNFFAKKDNNGRSVGIERFDPQFHKIEAGFVTDKNGNVLGNHIKVDETGMQVNVGGDIVNLDTITGNPQDWQGHYEVSSTMERNIYENAPNKEVADKTYKFVVANKIKNEAALKTELRSERLALNARTKDVMKAKPFSANKKEYKADVFDYIEGNLTQADLSSKYGKKAAMKMEVYKQTTRNLYDRLLDRANTEFEKFGEPTVAKRKDYITHINELVQKPSFAGELYGQLQNSILGEGKNTTRGEVPTNIAGRTENFEPRKKWNRFFQARKGGEFTKDPFKAVDAYLEPTLYNIHMTEPAVRARAVEAAFRTANEIKQMDTSHVSKELDESLSKYKKGKGSNLVTGFQEYANAVTGKTQRWDRQAVDAGKGPATLLHGWQKLQAIGGRSTVLGNAQSVLSQTLNQPAAMAQAGPINYIKGIAASIGSDKSIDSSPFIQARRTNVASKFRSRGEKVLDVGGVPLQHVEMAMVEQTWNAIHQKVKSEGLTGQNAIIETDRRTERTVAGRGIADKPELYRSTITNGIMQYTLEVNATNKQFWRDLSPKQKATFLVATTGMNSLVGAITGFEPLPDFLGAVIDSVGDFLDDKDKRSGAKKVLGGAQSMASQFVSMNPLAATAANVVPQDYRKKIFGNESTVGRFEGTLAPIKTATSAVNAVVNTAEGKFRKAADDVSRVTPFGNQIRKTTSGIETLNRGYAVDSKGEKTFDAPTSNFGKAKTVLFGPNSSPEAQKYYDRKSGTTSASTLPKDAPQGLKDVLEQKDQANKDLKTKFSDQDNILRTLSKADRKKLIDNGTVTEAQLKGLDNYERDQKVKLGLELPKEPKAETYAQKYDKALKEYNDPKTKYGPVEKMKKQKNLRYLTVQKDYENDVVALHGMSKADAYNFLHENPDGNRYAEQLINYDNALVKAGLLDKPKYAKGIKPATKGSGGKKGGKGGKKSAGGSLASTVFGNIDSTRSTSAKKLQQLLAGTTVTATKAKKVTTRKPKLKKVA